MIMGGTAEERRIQLCDRHEDMTLVRVCFGNSNQGRGNSQFVCTTHNVLMSAEWRW